MWQNIIGIVTCDLVYKRLLYRFGTNVIKYFEVYKQKVYPTPISDFIRKGNTLIRSCFTIIEHYWNFFDIGFNYFYFFKL